MNGGFSSAAGADKSPTKKIIIFNQKSSSYKISLSRLNLSLFQFSYYQSLRKPFNQVLENTPFLLACFLTLYFILQFLDRL